MISASHNPFYDNGIKVINGLGQKLEADIEAQIEAYIDDGTPKIPFATREAVSYTHLSWIEQRPSKPWVGGSNPSKHASLKLNSEKDCKS